VRTLVDDLNGRSGRLTKAGCSDRANDIDSEYGIVSLTISDTAVREPASVVLLATVAVIVGWCFRRRVDRLPVIYLIVH
jgi:hypothetical protein